MWSLVSNNIKYTEYKRCTKYNINREFSSFKKKCMRLAERQIGKNKIQNMTENKQISLNSGDESKVGSTCTVHVFTVNYYSICNNTVVITFWKCNTKVMDYSLLEIKYNNMS